MRCLLGVLLLAAGAVHAQDPDDEAAMAEQAYQMAAEEAKRLTLWSDGRRLEFESKPVMRWSNPVSGQVYGDVYVWTLDGRPHAIASIFKWFSPRTHLSIELQSLSDLPLEMVRESRRAWAPPPSLEMKPLTGAPAPRSRDFQRLQQMKALLSQFKAEAVDRIDADNTWFLRPVTKPIYRYSSDKAGVVDGALFAFCQDNTTNPEVILVLEARRKEDGTAWHYALGRQNSVQFRVYRNDDLVWDVPKLAPPWDNIKQPGNPYINLTIK